MATINNKTIGRVSSSKTSTTKQMKFYNSKRWRSESKAYANHQPLCEVSRAMGIIAEGHHTDHIIPIEMGGSKYDRRNLMRLTRSIHSLKTRHELSGKLTIAAMDTPNGKVPVDRKKTVEKIIKIYKG